MGELAPFLFAALARCCSISWNSSSTLLYFSSVPGVRVVEAAAAAPGSPSPSESPPSGLPGWPPLFSFLFRA